MTHKPWLKFYAADWLSSPELRACTLAEKGLLIDLMCIAHRHEPYGYFTDGTDESLSIVAQMVRIRLPRLVQMVYKLRTKGRVSASDGGQLYIKRMVADHDYSLQQSDFGRKGGNKALMATHKPDIEQSKSKSKSKRIKKKTADFELLEDMRNNKGMVTAWNEWQKHRREKGKALTQSTADKQIKRLHDIGASRAIAMINHSIEQGWTGLFERDKTTTATHNPFMSVGQ